MTTTMATTNESRFEHTESELKRPVRNPEIELESLSEWEIARLTSKTWSMEQD
ncbi:MAG: hypothetical protein JJ934_15275 [Pseudomonadales bacterium]|nr:hypothetical protein [Pseudomonadales bacterium]MBO6566926.1 hypothetical protein [Pseudomonadales bacterium]MBO6596366.1 hypothetical protein [Pseudomonadales bacterium]MBO6658257.1 hypothetical protein [Pseudomonadales bacterium]MBO6702977.1 hypothetical protein [Pseudomonadales bacterium]